MTSKWLRAAAIRALKTFAQAMLSFVTVGLAFHEVEWGYILSVAGVSAVYSLLTSLAGLPEAKPAKQSEGGVDDADG